MRVYFKSFGPLRRAIGESVIEVSVKEDATVWDVITVVIESTGESLSKLILDDGSISGNLIVLLNKRDITNLEGLNTRVSPDDEIAILPHVQGG